MVYLLNAFVNGAFADDIPQSQDQNQSEPGTIEEVIVRDTKQSLNEPTEQTEKLIRMPGALNDPIYAVFSLPGVLFSGSDTGEPAVRGSAPEDNAFLVDFMPAGYIFHPFGFSIFNDNIVQDFKLLPGAYPAGYGNATGAVFDITLREPRQQPLQLTLDYSLIRAGVFAEGSITSNQAFYFSYRHSLIHLYYDEGEEIDDEEGVIPVDLPKMSDYQGKYLWQLSEQSRLTFLLTGAADDFALDIEEDASEALLDPDIVGRTSYDQNFDSQSLMLDIDLNDNKDELRLALGHLSTELEFAIGNGQFLRFDDDTLRLKVRYIKQVNDKHTLTFGGERVDFNLDYAFDFKVEPCTELNPDCQPTREDRQQDTQHIDSKPYDFYIHDDWRLSEHLLLGMGLHATRVEYLDEKHLEPRLQLDWDVTEGWLIRLAAGEYTRFPEGEHIVRVIGNPELHSPKARHYVLGLNHQKENGWSWVLDLYQKDLYDLPLALDENLPDAELNYSNDVSGDAYGIEFMLDKALTDKWYGWFTLSLTRSVRRNNRTGEESVFVGDTPVVANLVFNYQINDRWNIGARWTYRTGAAYTEVVGIRENPDFPDRYLPVYGALNDGRLPYYMRLDIRAEYEFLIAKKYDASLVIDVLNATNRENISGYQYKPTEEDSLISFAVEQEEGLGIFPSVGFKITF